MGVDSLAIIQFPLGLLGLGRHKSFLDGKQERGGSYGGTGPGLKGVPGGVL